jgi:hypothetical protein
MKSFINCLLIMVLFSCDPVSELHYIVINKTRDSVFLIIYNQQEEDTIEILPAAAYEIVKSSGLASSSKSIYNNLGDSLDLSIKSIFKDSVESKKRWELKSNWIYQEIEKREAKLIYLIEGLDF